MNNIRFVHLLIFFLLLNSNCVEYRYFEEFRQELNRQKVEIEEIKKKLSSDDLKNKEIENIFKSLFARIKVIDERLKLSEERQIVTDNVVREGFKILRNDVNVIKKKFKDLDRLNDYLVDIEKEWNSIDEQIASRAVESYKYKYSQILNPNSVISLYDKQKIFEIESLILNGLPLTDLSSLNKFSNISTLSLRNCGLKTLNIFRQMNLPNLHTLDVSCNELKDLDGLQHLKINVLIVNNNDLTSLAAFNKWRKGKASRTIMMDKITSRTSPIYYDFKKISEGKEPKYKEPSKEDDCKNK